VALIWPPILSDKIEIDFAYQSFKWTNNAKGNAGVTVIILALRNVSEEPKYLFIDNFKKLAKNINPYLTDATNIIVTGKSKPISKFPEISFGNMANDGGSLLLSEEERDELISKNKTSEKFIKPFIGSSEYIRGNKRFCLWINNNHFEEAYKIPLIANRIDKVEIHRLNSRREATQVLAKHPNLFGEIRHQNSDSLLIPRHTSETRNYIPIGFFDSETIIADSAMAIYHAEPWLFCNNNLSNAHGLGKKCGGKIRRAFKVFSKIVLQHFSFP
jgi:hypothetical protein